MLQPTVRESKGKKVSITCEKCNATSYNPNDIMHLYCNRCYRFFETALVLPVERLARAK